MKKFLITVSAIAMLSACACGGSKNNVATDLTEDQVTASEINKQLMKIGNMVFFKFDSSMLSDESKAKLNAQVAFIKELPADTMVVIEGHCDERGTREYNLGLGERRANAVKQYVIAQGINQERVSTVSYGKERPLVAGHDTEAWKQNRRSVTIVHSSSN